MAASALFAALEKSKIDGARPYSVDVTLTRLALLASDSAIVAECSLPAVHDLSERYRFVEAGDYGRRSIALMECNGHIPSLTLLAETAEALEMTGEGEAAGQVLDKGVERISTLDGAVEDKGLSRFLFRLGLRQETIGRLDAAKSTFERICQIQQSLKNDHQLAVARGKIADILAGQGDVEEALRIRREEQLPVYTRLGDADSIAAAQFGIAQLEFAQEDYESGLSRLIESWTIVVETGRADGIAAIGEALGRLLAVNDTTQQEAADILRRSIVAYRMLGHEVDARRVETILSELDPE